MGLWTARIRTAVLTVALAAGVCAANVAPAQAAPARRLPVAYLGAGAGPWARPSIRPREFLLGADWTISHVTWADWTQRTASGHGRYAACAGADGPCLKFYATLTLSRIKVHRGKRYFATMKITGKHHRSYLLIMNTKLGWWQPK